jgi:hypothetical protein
MTDWVDEILTQESIAQDDVNIKSLLYFQDRNLKQRKF